MKIAGLQKTTLLDYPGKVACTVFLAGCNFRCPYCQNAEIAFAQGGEDIPQEELLAFLRRRRGILDGVCVTGGEPLVHARIGELLRKIKALGYAVKLDTNGSFPARLKALCAEGLVDFVAMDIKHAPRAIRAGGGRARGYGRDRRERRLPAGRERALRAAHDRRARAAHRGGHGGDRPLAARGKAVLPAKTSARATPCPPAARSSPSPTRRCSP